MLMDLRKELKNTRHVTTYHLFGPRYSNIKTYIIYFKILFLFEKNVPLLKRKKQSDYFKIFTERAVFVHIFNLFT